MDIVTALERRYGDVVVQGDEALIDCPFCGDGGHNLSVNIGDREGAWHCWVCGEAGSTRKRNDPLLKGLPIRKGTGRLMKKERKSWDGLSPGDCVSLMNGGGNSAMVDLIDAWFRQRFGDRGGALRREANEHWGWQWCVNATRKEDGSPAFAGGTFDTYCAMVFPVEENGECIGWQARRTVPEDVLRKCGQEAVANGPKYYTVYGLDKGEHLYNIDNASQGNLVVVVEGVMDALSVGRSAVATFGCSPKEAQANLLKARWDCVVVLYDPDKAGREGTDKLVQLLHPREGGRLKVVPVELQGYGDPGECPRREIWRQIREAAAAQGVDIDQYRYIYDPIRVEDTGAMAKEEREREEQIRQVHEEWAAMPWAR